MVVHVSESSTARPSLGLSALSSGCARFFLAVGRPGLSLTLLARSAWPEQTKQSELGRQHIPHKQAEHLSTVRALQLKQCIGDIVLGLSVVIGANTSMGLGISGCLFIPAFVSSVTSHVLSS